MKIQSKINFVGGGERRKERGEKLGILFGTTRDKLKKWAGPNQSETRDLGQSGQPRTTETNHAVILKQVTERMSDRNEGKS